MIGPEAPQSPQATFLLLFLSTVAVHSKQLSLETCLTSSSANKIWEGVGGGVFQLACGCIFLTENGQLRREF